MAHLKIKMVFQMRKSMLNFEIGKKEHWHFKGNFSYRG